MIKTLQIGIEIGLTLFALAVIYSQMLRPYIRGTPLFPFFRRRPKIERELEVVNEEIEDKQLAGQLESRRRELGDTDK